MASDLCIVRSGASVPARWRETFPGGMAITLPALLAQARGPVDPPPVLWLAGDEADWPEQLAQILRARPDDRVIVLSGNPRDDEALLALESGARGYCHAYAVPALLREVALVVRHGGFWLGPGLLRRLVRDVGQALPRPTPHQAPVAVPRLSPRETEVALAVREGCSNKEIATRLGISERTVKAHLGAVFEKLGVRDRLQLVLHLSELGAGDSATPLPVPPSNRHAMRAGLT